MKWLGINNWFSKPEKTKEDVNTLDSSQIIGYKIESPEELLLEYQGLVDAIQDTLALSEEDWERCALPTIKNFAGFVQKVPASRNNHHSFSKGLLAHSLEVARFALRLYRNENFVYGYPMETRKFMEEKWGMAVLYAALLHDSAKVVTDISIKSPDGKHEWNGVAESIYDWARRLKLKSYILEYNDERKYNDHEVVNNIISSRIMTPESLSFMTEYDSDVVTSLLYSLTGQNQSGRKRVDKLTALAKEADHLSVERDKKRYKSPDEKITQVISPMDRLTDLVCLLIKNHEKKAGQDNTWGVNIPGAGLFMSEGKKGGVWIAWENKKIETLKAFAKETQGYEDLAKLPDVVVDGMLTESGVFYERQGRNKWSCSVSLGDWANRLDLRLVTHPDIINAVVQKNQKSGNPYAELKTKDDFADLLNMPYSISEYMDRNDPAKRHNDPEDLEEPVSGEEDESDIESEVEDEAQHESNDEAEVDSKTGVEVEVEVEVEKEEKPKQSVESKSNSNAKAKNVQAPSTTLGSLKKPDTPNPAVQKSNTDKANSTKQRPMLPTKKSSEPTVSDKKPSASKQKPSLSRNIGVANKGGGNGVSPPFINDKFAVKKQGAEATNKEPNKKGKKKGIDEGLKSKVAQRIDPNSCPNFKRLQEQGSSGPILSTIGVNYLLEELKESDVFKTEQGYVACAWPKSLSGQGREPLLLRESLILESAIIPSDEEGKVYLHEIKSPENKMVSCLVLSPVFANMFEKAFLGTTDESTSHENTEKAIEKPTKKVEKKDKSVDKGMALLDQAMSGLVSDLIIRNGWLSEPVDIHRNKNGELFIKADAFKTIIKHGFDKLNAVIVSDSEVKRHIIAKGEWAKPNPAVFKMTSKAIQRSLKK